MGTPRLWTEDECREEIAFILTVNDQRNPGRDFNYTPECFKRYVADQRRWIARCGFVQLAGEIAHIA